MASADELNGEGVITFLDIKSAGGFCFKSLIKSANCASFDRKLLANSGQRAGYLLDRGDVNLCESSRRAQ